MSRDLIGASIVLTLFPSIILGQVFIDCPLNWYSFQDHCYKFTPYPRVVYEEATATCQAQGAGLLSVNSYDEHNFINTQLLSLDPQRSLWWTSGIHQGGKVKWNGDGTFQNPDTSYWYTPAIVNSLAMHVVYRYTANLNAYQWGKEDGNEEAGYICEIPRVETSRIVQDARDFTYGTNISDPGLAPRGPTFLIQPHNVVLTTRSFLPSIECLAEGNPQPKHTWHKRSASGDDTIVTSSPFYTLSNGKLTFDNINETRDTGVYYCVAQNRFGSIRTEPAVITFGRLEQFSNVPQATTNVQLYQGTYLNCYPPTFKPAAIYQWQKGKSFLQPTLNSYFFISSNGNLYFSEVQQSDHGNYHCVVTLAALPGDELATEQPPTKTSMPIALNVRGNTASDFPPIIHNDFPQVYPRGPVRGQTIKIECFAYGRIPLAYSWTRPGKALPSKAYVEDFNRVLVIPNVQYSDEGTYTCTVSGSGQVDTKDFTLTINAKPYFVYPLKDLVGDETQEISWRCEALARPRASYTWYKNSQLLAPVPGEIEISTNVLTIRNLDMNRHNGMYQCAASNVHGTAISSAQLKVLSFRPTFTKNPLPLVMLAAQGGNLTIPCKPEAAPTPTIKWLKNGVDMSLSYGDGSQSGAQKLTNGFLKIVNVNYGDRGLYTCVAENKNGKAQVTTNVTVAGGVRITIPPGNKDTNKNQTAFLFCQASYDYQRYDLVYLWRFNGRLIDFDNDPHYSRGEQDFVTGLYINYPDFKHAGEYECIAKTTVTQATAKATLRVKGPPGEPARVYAVKGSITSRSIKLKWMVPPSHDYGIRYYVIEGSTRLNNSWVQLARVNDTPSLLPTDPDQSDRRVYQLTGLIPYNDYRFRVYAVNGFNLPGDYSRPSEYYRTPGDKPIKAVTNVGGGAGSEGVLTMTWNMIPEQYKSGPGFGYYVYWKKKGSGDYFFRRNISENYEFLLKQNTSTGMIASFTESNTIGLKNYYLPYEVKIGVRNQYGDGPNSTVSIVYSSEGIPLARPTNVNGWEINSTALWVTWDPLNNTREAVKGVVQGYEINVEDFNDPYRKSTTTWHYGQMNANSVIGLEPNSDYWVTVQVFNTAGQSNPSERQRLSTCLNAPLLYPEFVNIYSHGPTSVYVEWRGVSTGLFEETLRGYKLRWWLVGDDIRKANDTVTGKETQGVIYGIQKNNVYQLRVLGYSKGGDGKMSPTKFFTLGGMVPVDRTISEIRAAAESISTSLATLLICLCSTLMSSSLV